MLLSRGAKAGGGKLRPYKGLGCAGASPKIALWLGDIKFSKNFGALGAARLSALF
jgi:hypothetical protein